MKTMTVALLKSQFSHVIEGLIDGEEYLIEYGKGHKKLGVIIPYKKHAQKKRKLGLVEGKATYSINGDFKITSEELSSL